MWLQQLSLDLVDSFSASCFRSTIPGLHPLTNLSTNLSITPLWLDTVTDAPFTLLDYIW